MEVDMEYLKERIDESLEDILKNDCGENKMKSLEYLNTTIAGVCDLLKLISYNQAVELREPIVREMKKLNKF